MEFYTEKHRVSSKLLNVKGGQVLGFGTPAYRFKQERDIRSVNFLEEEEIVHRTNEFVPAGNRSYEFTNHQVRSIVQPVPETLLIEPEFLQKLINEDTKTRKQYEEYDALRGNSLISVTEFDEPIYVFSAGESLSTIVFTYSTKKKCQIDDHIVDIRFDNISMVDMFELEYPIQQIIASPLMNNEGGFVGVRTTSTITMFKLDNTQDDKMKITKVHQFHLAEKTLSYPDIAYSMPCDIALSPFSNTQYLFTTNNGFMALVDISRDEVLFEGVDKVGDGLDYASRWRSCSYSHVPSKYYIASPECIREWTVTKTKIRSRIISIPQDRIFSFTFQYPILCYATTKEVRVFDIRNNTEPIIDWVHEMRDGPPTYVFITSEKENGKQWTIGAFSSISDRLSIIKLYYNPELTADLKKKVKIEDYFRLELPKNKFEPIYEKVDVIHSVGLSACLTIVPVSGDLFYSVYRLFEDGTIKVQYILLRKDNSNGKNPELRTKPRYRLNDDRFEKLYLAVELSKLPASLDSSKSREVANIKNRVYREYLEHITEFNEIAGPIPSSTKIDLADKLRAAKGPITYYELFGKESTHGFKLEDLMSHLEEMKEIEEAEELPFLNSLIKGAWTDNESQFPNQSKNLKEAHEKEITLSRIRLHCPKQDNDSSTFQYLPKNTKFRSTMTTRILADDWKIDNTPSEFIEIGMLDENDEIGKEVFSLVSAPRRRKSVSFSLESSSIPSISLSTPADATRVANLVAGEAASMFDNINEIPTISSTQNTIDDSQLLTPQVSSQVLPGRHGGRPVKKPSSKKKKKAKTSGFR